MSGNQEDQRPHYTITTEASIAVMTFRGDIFALGTDLTAKTRLLAELQAFDRNPEIRAILFLNDHDVMSDGRYADFVTAGVAARHSWAENADQAAGYVLERHGNALLHTVQTMTEITKPLILAMDGDVASPLFGVGLAADYRFATEDMTLQPSHLKLGLPPGGGLGFFLPRYVGQRQARDLLASTDPIPAARLLDLGLVDRCFPAATFRESCLAAARELASLPQVAFAGIKSVLNFHVQDLADFQRHEEAAMLRGYAALGAIGH